MVKDTEVELWSIWLGGDDHTKHFKKKISIRNVPFCELNDVEDSIDWYSENFYVPQRKSTSIAALGKDDISFVFDNWGSCLSIRKEFVGV